jgi:hypothetical protein
MSSIERLLTAFKKISYHMYMEQQNEESVQAEQEDVLKNKKKLTSVVVIIVCILILIPTLIYTISVIFSPVKVVKKIVPTVTPTVSIKIATTSATYPFSRYPSLATQVLKRNKDALISQLGQGWKVVLDDYGFPTAIEVTDPVFLGNKDYSQIISEKVTPIFTQAEISVWEKFLIQHGSIFGIDPNTTIKLVYINTMNNRTDYLEVRQTFSGRNLLSFVPGGAIQILKEFAISGNFAQLQAIKIEGHFWPQLTIPSQATIPTIQIENLIVGQPYDTQIVQPCNQIGEINPTCSQTTIIPQVIKKTDIIIDVVPYMYKKADNSIEGRIAYRVQSKLVPHWIEFFDAITKQQLAP